MTRTSSRKLSLVDLPTKTLWTVSEILSKPLESWAPRPKEKVFPDPLDNYDLLKIADQNRTHVKLILTVSARKKLSMWSSCVWSSTSDIWQYPQGHRAPYCKLTTMSRPASRYLQRNTINNVSVAKKWKCINKTRIVEPQLHGTLISQWFMFWNISLIKSKITI